MSQQQEEKQLTVIDLDDYVFDEDFKEGKFQIFPVIISSDSEDEVDRDQSPCPSPPIITDSDDESDSYVPGTPQDYVPETPLSSDDESINLPIDEELAVPPPSPEFGGSSPDL
jgi:hypothetical protein